MNCNRYTTDFVIIEVDGSKLDPSLFRPDENWLMKAFDIPYREAKEIVHKSEYAQFWKLGLFAAGYNNLVGYMGTIPLGAITDYHINGDDVG